MTNAARKLPDDETDQRTVVQEATIDCRFRSWAKENKGGWFHNIGYPDRNILVSIEQHGGEVPDRSGYRGTIINFLADQIEEMLVKMRDMGDFKIPARVVEAEYLQDWMPLTQKLSWLGRKHKIWISPSTYYKSLKQAKAYAIGYTSALKTMLR